MNVLFVCSYGEIRSVTARKMFGGKIIEKGLSDASPKTIRRMSEWADVIYVMTPIHTWTYKKFYPEYLDKIIELGIEDYYGVVSHPKLKEMLIKKLKRYGFKDSSSSKV